MPEALDIPDWHEKLLAKALDYRTNHPDFRFALRTADVSGTPRLPRGFWFPGNERYLWFPPYRVNDSDNKTKTIGFMIPINRQRQPEKSVLTIVFGSVKDGRIKAVHERLVAELGPFEQKWNTLRFERAYPQADPLEAFDEFLTKDYPRIRRIVEESDHADAFTVSESDFQTMLNRVSVHRARLQRGQAIEAVAVSSTGEAEYAARNLILYGPPGTGKTHWLRQKFSEYTDRAEQLDRDQWAQKHLAGYGWRAVIAAVMADIGRPVRVPDIRDHPYTAAKARERGREVGGVPHPLEFSSRAHFRVRLGCGPTRSSCTVHLHEIR